MRSRMTGRLVVACGVLIGAMTVDARLVTAPPSESRILIQDQTPAGPGRRQEPGVRLEEPASARSAQPGSTAMARALDRVRARPARVGEAFVLIKVTDRRTGERRILTRGVASTEVARALQEPGSAPAGLAYAEGDEIHADEDVEVVTRSVIVRPTRGEPDRLSREQEREGDLEARAARGFSPRIGKGLRRRLETGSIDGAGGRMVPVVIDVKGVPRLRLPKIHELTEAGLLYAGLEVAAERERGIIERKRMMPKLQAGLSAAIESMGGQITYASWTSGALEAEVPAFRIAELAEHPDLLSVEYAEPAAADAYFNGQDWFSALDPQDFDTYHPGTHGLTSRHSFTSRVLLAMAEQCIDQTNPAWLDGVGVGFGSRGYFYDCDGSSACSGGGLEGCSGSVGHGTQVASAMTADLMDGQDPLLSADDRRRMTGTCPECRFIFMQDQGLNQRSKVHDFACEQGADIYESSISTVAPSCDGDGPWQGSVQSLIDCGAVYVQSAGNDGTTGSSCNTHFPADHPWTLAVSGIETQTPCDNPGSYYTADCPIAPGSSRGGASYAGGGEASVIDLAAPFWTSGLIVPLARNPISYTFNVGTSFATPLVAGLTAEMMDWYKVHLGTSIFYGNRARNFMMLFGDRSSGTGGTSRLTNDTSVYWGAGRVGLVPFDQKLIWDIARTSSSLGRNDSWSFSTDVNSYATFYKAVVWHDGTNYANEPMIRLSLDPQGCANPTLSVDRLDNKVILVYTDLDGCTSIDVSITNVGQGFSGSRLFHFASYSDTEDERNY